MRTTAARAGTRVPPLAIYLGGYAMATVIQEAFPIRLPTGPAWSFFATAVAVVGALVVFASVRTLRRSGTTVAPNGTVTVLVTTGPYRLSRNPIYLGFACVYAGVGCALGA